MGGAPPPPLLPGMGAAPPPGLLPGMGGMPLANSKPLPPVATDPSQLAKGVTLPQGVKLKTLHWEKIKETEFHDSIWAKVNANPDNFKLELPDFVDLFEEKVVIKKEEVKSAESAKVAKVSLIDDEKRVQQFNVAVKKITDMMKLSFSDIRKMVMALDDSELGYDTFINLMYLAPTPDEISKVSSFKGDPVTLDTPSRWVFEMKDIPIFKPRIELYAFSKDYDGDYSLATERVTCIEEYIKFFTEDKRFLAFMKCCLDIGNLINFYDNRKSKSVGFKFQYLKSFMSCKSNNGKLYLMPYLLDKINEQNTDIIDFFQPMFACVNQASTFDLDDVINTMDSLKAKFNQIKTHLESAEKRRPPDEDFISNLGPFFQANVKKCMELGDKARSTKETFLNTVIMMGDDPKKIKGVKTNDIVGEYRKIFQDLAKFIEPILKQKEKEKKSGMKKEKKEKNKRVALDE
jgi:hypothetical protein